MKTDLEALKALLDSLHRKEKEVVIFAIAELQAARAVVAGEVNCRNCNLLWAVAPPPTPKQGRPTDGAWEDFCQSVATHVDENDAAQLWQMLAYVKSLEARLGITQEGDR